MPLEFDITQPVNEQKVGHTVVVVGSFTGVARNPFNMTCTISTSSAGGGPKVYTQTLPGQVNFQNETWQCTFENVPSGTYDISAQIAAHGGPVGKSGDGSNPVTEVVVADDLPIIIDPVAAADTPDGGQGWNKLRSLTLRGRCAAGYGLADGYLVYAHLRLAGQQVSSEGRLTAVWPTASGTEWQYVLQLPTWAWSPAAVLVAELWKVNQQPQEHQKPVASVASPIRVND